jgi:FkbM family methyltransferase
VRKALKYLLPHGLIEVARHRRRLQELGREVSWRDCWRSDWLMHEAVTSGLDLFPPGYWPKLKWVVDVGANVGQWSTMLLDLITPEKLVMIEPEPAAFAKLKSRFAGRANIELHQVAVGDRDGVTRFRITRDTTGASVLPPRLEMRELIGQNWTVESEIECPMKKLDTILAGFAEISLLKMDVQGFEEQVIAGAAEVLRRTKFLLIELNYMPQYEGGSWLGAIHETLTRQHSFFLANASKPLCLNGRASMCDGLYVNRDLVGEWVKPDFI